MYLLKHCERLCESASVFCTHIAMPLPPPQSIPLITLSSLQPKPSSEPKTSQSWQSTGRGGKIQGWKRGRVRAAVKNVSGISLLPQDW